MESIIFDGQQTDERVLYTIYTHPVRRLFGNAITIGSGVFLLIIFVLLWQSETLPYGIPFLGVIFAVGWMIAGLLWQELMMKENRAYITDRRFIRFERVTPVLTTKRSLFWSDVLKAKAFSPNVFLKKMNVGTLQLEPVAAEGEEIHMPYVHFSEDIANYIDKILYLSKNTPSEILSMRPFVAKSKWQRGVDPA